MLPTSTQAVPLFFQRWSPNGNYAWVVTVSGREEPDQDSDGDADADADADPSSPESDAEPSSGSEPPAGDDSGGFLGNLKNAKGQLGDAKEAFSNARGAGNLPTDEEGRVRIVCRRYEERRLVPLDDKGRPTCYEAGNEDCESCVDAVSDGDVGTW